MSNLNITDGFAGNIFRNVDWSKHPMGPIDTWPVALQVSLSILFNSKSPLLIWWGPEHYQFYNDASLQCFTEGQALQGMGQPASECWPVIWPQIKLTFDRVSGYSFIFNTDGSKGGNFVACKEAAVFAHHFLPLEARTAIENARRSIENERENFRNLFKHTPEMVCILRGPEHVFEFVNDAHGRVLGFDATGKTVREAQPESVEVHEMLDEVYRTGKTAQLLEIPVTLGGRQRYFNLTYSARRSSKGQIKGLMILGIEITDHILMREAISSQKQALELTLQGGSTNDILEVLIHMVEQQLGAGVLASAMLISEDGQHLLNGSAPGLPESYNAATHGMKIGPQEGSCGTAAYFGKTVIAADIATDPLWSQYKDFALSHGLHACWSTPIFSSEGKVLGTFAIYYNQPHTPTSREQQLVELVTRTATLVIERRSAVDDLQKAKIEAEAANESKTRFLANISHEIRTPLAAILGFSELLKGRTQEGDPEAETQLDRISRNATQLGRLIDDLLDLSKIEADHFEIEREDFDVMVAIEDALASINLRALEKGLVIHQSSAGSLPRVINTDPTRFRQILINMLGNAVKFTETGHVDLHLEIKNEGSKSMLLMRVKDTGIGLSTDHQKRIFSRFVQGDASVTRKYGGTGLGLVLSRRLAQLMGGDLILENSEPGVGSSFVVTIELGQLSNPEGQSKGDRDKQIDLKSALAGLNILVVDDSQDNQMICKIYVEIAGGKVEIANNGYEAVQRINEEPFDAVVMDIQMPVMDGYQALKLARERGYRKPIIALTAHALKEEKDACLEAGFTDYISKPINRNALIYRLAALCKKA